VDHRAIRAQTGNSVAVPVIRAIAKQMIQALSKGELRSQAEAESNLFATLGI